MEIGQEVIKSMRKIGLEQVYYAHSGHTGIVLGATTIMYAVFKNAKITNKDADWLSRDRIVLSAGHGSALLYSALYHFGFLSLDDIKQFRKFGSNTQGHPSIKTCGVDCSTGALGQGIGNAVGLAVAEKFLSSKYNEKVDLIDNYTFCICGYGDLMEGVGYEACSFAGKNKLNKLILLYDANRNTLDGKLDMSFNEDIKARFEAQYWQVLSVDGNNLNEIDDAIKLAKQSIEKPTLIICNTTIGYGSVFADNSIVHSNPFTEETFKKFLDSQDLPEEPFFVSQEVFDFCDNLMQEKLKVYKQWQKNYNSYARKHPLKIKELTKTKIQDCVKQISKIKFKQDMSTRDASSVVLNELAKFLPNLIGGSADVAKSTKAQIQNEDYFSPTNYKGRNIAFGIREFAMGTICNGLALYGGGIFSFASTLAVFSDYMRSSIRMSAIMNLQMLYIFTHDSITMGEDGATHQPVEQIESFRLMPNIRVFRPCDAKETLAGYCLALKRQEPTILFLNNYKLPLLENSNVEKAQFGGYVISYELNRKELHGILIATGSEVELALQAQKIMQDDGLSIRVVSMPDRELFLQQDKKYQNSVLPIKNKARIVIEAGATAGWYKIVGNDGYVLGVDDFGESGNRADLYKKFKITLPNIVKIMDKLIKFNQTIVESVI